MQKNSGLVMRCLLIVVILTMVIEYHVRRRFARDPTLTIKAPYSQGDVTMYFGENAEKQCVAISLIALIYKKIREIHTCSDLVQSLERVINCIQHCHNVQGRCI